MESMEEEENPSGSSSDSSSPLMGNLNPNSRIIGELFNGMNYKKKSYSTNRPLARPINWDMLIEPYQNYRRITPNMLNERQKVC